MIPRTCQNPHETKKALQSHALFGPEEVVSSQPLNEAGQTPRPTQHNKRGHDGEGQVNQPVTKFKQNEVMLVVSPFKLCVLVICVKKLELK